MVNYSYIKDIEIVLSAVKIRNSFSYSWLHETILLIPSNLKRVLPDELVKRQLIKSLTQNLYAHFYCKGFITSTKNLSTRIYLPSLQANYSKQLSASNQGQGYLDDGWIITGSEADKIAVEKNGFKLILKNSEYVSFRNDKDISVLQCMPKESHFLSPGFFMAFGNNDLRLIDVSPIIRFYWNINSKGAIPLVFAITAMLNHVQLPFRFKILDQPDQFDRCDSAVLYTYKKHYEQIRDAIESIHSEIKPYLKFETPIFTKSLAFGLGLAEDPEQGISFGMHRCQILAEAIVNACNHNKKSVTKRLQIVQQYFKENNISLERPYLNPGSTDIYHFNPGTYSNKPISGKKEEQNRKPEDQSLVETAYKIGLLLSSKAFWYKDRCTWMALTPNNAASENGEPISLLYKTLGPDLYSGTSGIALFLAELYAATGDSSMRSLSLGAIRQSLFTMDKIQVNLSLGLYTGLTGIAFASAYIGKLLGEEQLLYSATRILYTVLTQREPIGFPDQIAGSAGAISTLLILKDLLNDENLFAFAKKLGDGLVENAICRDNHCSWKSPNFPKQQNLLGFSHGTAGIAYSLIELFGATGDFSYRKVAESAFDYEHYWFNKEKENWPDLRGVKASVKKEINAFNFPVAWCHGAPGIAISRLLAYKVLQDDQYKAEALTALKITEEWTSKMLDTEQVNLCLCHGLIGNADILLCGYQALGKDFSSGYDLASAVACTGIKFYAQQNQWPFGILGDNAPSLMTGLSGVGLFYLRLQNPGIPSLLAFDQKKMLQRMNSANVNIRDLPIIE